MLFSSLLFLYLFLPVVLGFYYLLPHRWRNGFLFLANLIFYGFGEPVFVLLMLCSVLINWAGGLLVARSQTESARCKILVLTLVINLGLLGTFKYAGFLSDTLRLLPPLSGLPEIHIPLPIGISFYTFQAMSYVIDVYRGDCTVQKSYFRFGTYISLFPQLIAGPIVRYCDVAEQLENPYRESAEMFGRGGETFLVGLAKKVLLANPMGLLWTTISADPSSLGTLGAWAGVAAYSLHIYFDFSGYSDMAKGLGRMFGFEFCDNFNYPYVARNVSDFWRRWHMSLTTWFRDYVYIPLGGNRRGTTRTLLNIFLVWALTGLWHGASWNFVLWGLFYGVLILLERVFLNKFLQKLPVILQHVYTLVMINLGWTLFALEDLSVTLNYLGCMFHIQASSNMVKLQLISYLPLAFVGVFACLPIGRRLWFKLSDHSRNIVGGILALLTLALCTAALVSDSYNPFLYFRF